MTQETAAALRSLKRDLALCAIMSAGNDYLPSVPGGGLSAKEGKPSLWGTYLGLRAGKQGWRHGCAPRFHCVAISPAISKVFGVQGIWITLFWVAPEL